MHFAHAFQNCRLIITHDFVHEEVWPLDTQAMKSFQIFNAKNADVSHIFPMAVVCCGAEELQPADGIW